jgi:outer membrane usher protein
MTAAAPAEASKVAATPPNWDAKKEERFQNQVDKIFASKKKKQGNQGETVINIPVYFEGKSKPIGQVDARVKENEATQIDGVAFFKYLRDLIAPSWFEKPEIKAVTPSDQEIKDAGTGANRKWIGVEPFQNSGVNITYNDKLLELRIDVPPAFRSTELATLDTRGGENIDQAEKPANFSSFLNVNGSDVMDTRDMTYHDHRSPLHAQLENGTNLYGYVLEANGTFAEQRSEVDTTEKQFTRQDVRIVKDFPDWGIRTRVGDLLYPVDRYQVFRTMAGVAVTSQFGMKNSKLTYPSGNYELFLQRPSKVYVWINDQLMQVLNLEAGRHQIKDFPFASGMNEIRLEIVDDLGRTETQTYSYFSSSDLLAPGLHQFNYAVGAPSTTNFGERSYDSSKPIVSLFHHYGWNETLTLGANVQSTDGQAVYGVDALMSTTVGYFKLETARSTNDIYGDGFASGIRYLFSDHGGVEKSQRTFNLGVSQQSEQFTSLAQGSNPTNNYLLYEVTAGYTTGLSRSLSGNIGVKYDINKQPTPDIGDSFSLSVGVNKRWDDGPTTSLTLSHTRSEKGDEQISALLFLVWSFPKDNQVITATNNTAAHTTRADWSYNPSSGANSANYSVDVSDGQTEQGYGGQINYNGNRSRISLADEVILTKQNANTSTATDQSQSKKSNNLATLQFGTALVFAGGHFAVSRPVTDSFAVIAPVKNLKGQRLDLNPDSEGRYIASSTPWLGAAVAPELSSYNFSTLTIGSKHVPAEMSVPRDHYDLYPGYKSGYIFELGTDATVYLVASLKNSKGQPLSNSSGRAIYLDKAGEEPVVVFTNRKGSLRSEGFKPGRYRLEMAGEQQLEATELTIPESANGEYEAGTLQLKGQ